MKIKYNFGLLKNVNIGFSSLNGTSKYYGKLLNVKKIKSNYRFIYENNYLEIDELMFSNSCIIKQNDIYWFVPQKENTCSGLFLFTMFDTYGFPLELSKEEFEREGIIVDEHGFYLMKELQKLKSQNTFKK